MRQITEDPGKLSENIPLTYSCQYRSAKDCPLLVVSSVVAPDTNCLTFLVFASLDVKDLAVLPVYKLFILILEDLEPLRGRIRKEGHPDLEQADLWIHGVRRAVTKRNFSSKPFELSYSGY